MALRGQQGLFGAPFHSRAPECSGRHPESSVAGPWVGMDPLFSSLQGPSSMAGDYRFLRNFVEPSPSRLLLADGGSTVGGHRCDDAAVGLSSGLCLPPFDLLQRAITKVRQSRGFELTLVAPFWPQHSWFLDLLELLVAVPVFLPCRKDLLKQPHFHRFQQNLHVLCLTAYRISSAPPAPSTSLRQWLDNLPTADAPPPE